MWSSLNSRTHSGHTSKHDITAFARVSPTVSYYVSHCVIILYVSLCHFVSPTVSYCIAGHHHWYDALIDHHHPKCRLRVMYQVLCTDDLVCMYVQESNKSRIARLTKPFAIEQHACFVSCCVQANTVPHFKV